MQVRSAKDGFETEFDTEIDDRNHASAKVDDAFYKIRHLRDGRDLLHADDFAHLEHGDPVGFAVQSDG